MARWFRVSTNIEIRRAGKKSDFSPIINGREIALKRNAVTAKKATINVPIVKKIKLDFLHYRDINCCLLCCDCVSLKRYFSTIDDWREIRLLTSSSHLNVRCHPEPTRHGASVPGDNEH